MRSRAPDYKRRRGGPEGLGARITDVTRLGKRNEGKRLRPVRQRSDVYRDQVGRLAMLECNESYNNNRESPDRCVSERLGTDDTVSENGGLLTKEVGVPCRYEIRIRLDERPSSKVKMWIRNRYTDDSWSANEDES